MAKLRNAAVPAAEQAASRRRGAETAPAQPARTPALQSSSARTQLRPASFAA